VQLGSALWSAYERFIVPRKKADSNAGLISMIRTDDGSLTSFWIGNQYRDRNHFLEEFTAKVEMTRSTEADGKTTEKVVAEIRSGGGWVRRK
jgi:hypothetical protein